MAFNQDSLSSFPDKPGVYIMKDAKKTVLYVGKAKVLKERVKQYFGKSGDNRIMIPFLTRQVEEIETIVTFTEKEALLLENTLIKHHQPKYNILLKDDKTYLSIKINHQNKYPMVKLVRFTGTPQKDGLYFGPYTSALAARQTYETITKVFPLRQCSDRELTSRKRPCILYSIKRCIAPCVGKCTKEEYQEVVSETIDFLKGKTSQVTEALKKKIEEASEKLQFERAATILRTIKHIEEIAKEKSAVQTSLKQCDAFALLRKDNFILIVKLIFREGRLIGSEHYDFSLVLQTDDELLTSFLLQHYQKETPAKEILLPIELEDLNSLEEILHTHISCPIKGEKKKLIDLCFENAKALIEQIRENSSSNEALLLQMQEVLNLRRLPSHIECFDTSNISGQDAVASMSVFIDGVKNPKFYRLYRIKKEGHIDDYAAITEVLTRRLKRAKEEDAMPDLIIIDGGKGQLSTAEKVLKELDIVSIDLIALTKEDARHDKGLTKERVFTTNQVEPISLDPRSPLLFLLQRIRDEAHRKAITYHRKSRTKKGLESLLDSVPGIGPTKKMRLLKQFGSVKRIKEATEEELLSVDSITKQDALNLKTHL